MKVLAVRLFEADGDSLFLHCCLADGVSYYQRRTPGNSVLDSIVLNIDDCSGTKPHSLEID